MTKDIDPAEFRRKSVAVADRVDAHLELKSVMDALAKRDAEITTFAEKATEEIKTHGKVLDETKSALEKLSGSGAELQERLVVVEQKLARRGTNDAIAFAGKSVGQEFTESDEFKELQAKGRGTARYHLKSNATLTSATSGAGGVGDAIQPHRVPGIVAPPDRPMTVRDLFAQGQTTSNAVEYVKESGFSNNAAAVAENPDSAKPKSDLTFDIAQTTVKTLAHIFKASKQALDDVPMLASYIDTRGRYGLKYLEEQQLLSGNGMTNNLLGVIPQATTFSETTLLQYAKAPISRADILRLAMLQVRTAEYRATGIVMNPLDWAAIELDKSTEDERYIWASPRGLAAPGMWSLPVVDTMAIPAGQFMVGAFNIAAQVWDRQQATVEVANQNNDDFEKNILAIRIEERLALTVYRPQSFVHGYFAVGGSPLLNA
jgi:HK97 family phage major capsid protein